MKRIGAFVGKFLPPHIGHLSVVEQMLKECDEVVIVISDNLQKSKKLCEEANFPYFNSQQRLRWFREHFKNNFNVHFAIIDESRIADSQNAMADYANLFWECVPFNVNQKYADSSYGELNKKYFPNCKFVEIDRNKINIHGTMIRNDWKENKKFVMLEAQNDIENAKNIDFLH